MKDLQPAGINDDMPLDENSWIHGAGGGIDEGYFGNGFSGG